MTAKQLLTSPDILDRVVRVVRQWASGDERLIKVIYLAATTRLMQPPLQLAILSTRRTHFEVFRPLFPPDTWIEESNPTPSGVMSRSSLPHDGKVLTLLGFREHGGRGEIDLCWRWTRERPAFIEITTCRLAARDVEYTIIAEGAVRRSCDRDFASWSEATEPWRQAQELLVRTWVQLPDTWARLLLDRYPWLPCSGSVLRQCELLIMAVAFLHQHQRQTHEAVLATPEDMQIAMDLASAYVHLWVPPAPPHTERVWEVGKAAGGPVSAPDVARCLDISRAEAEEALCYLWDIGVMDRMAEPRLQYEVLRPHWQPEPQYNHEHYAHSYTSSTDAER